MCGVLTIFLKIQKKDKKKFQSVILRRVELRVIKKILYRFLPFPNFCNK